MNEWKIDTDTLTTGDIEKWIDLHSTTLASMYSSLWDYYNGKNTNVLSKPPVKDGSPDNRTPVAYGRKIVTTFTGYAFRPGYTRYSSSIGSESPYLKSLDNVFYDNDEIIKTSRAGRNIGIFGASFEIVYSDNDAKPRFFTVDPRECFILYDNSPEPQKKAAIRYMMASDDTYIVEVYYANRVEKYTRVIRDEKAEYTLDSTSPNLFGSVPVVAYYFGDDHQGLINPVKALIDDYDSLVSDSFIEFSRFANSYLRIVGQSIGAGVIGDSGDRAARQFLAKMREKRIFSGLNASDDVTFLTKDIPTAFIEFMSKLIRDQIHIQSHVPDLGSEAFASGVSGAAFDRLMFDFENVCSSIEPDFDTGLRERIELINRLLALDGIAPQEGERIIITHKRNLPANNKEAVEIATMMSAAGFSKRSIAEAMPESLIPDTNQELEAQESDMALMPNLDAMADDGDGTI